MEQKINEERLRELVSLIDCTDHGYCPWYREGCGCARDRGVMAIKDCIAAGLEWLRGED